MSDPKRANLITVSAPKSAKVNVKKTVRLTIDLYESNESKYPELDYKELVRAEASKEKRVNGKTTELDPFSDYDEEVERVARKFEQKYGGNSTYGKKGRKKCDDFADIGAGYDENDSFIDNTDGYDEMIPPGIDTLYGGFYINCGSLEFTTVPEKQNYPEERNKRRKSSSSSSCKESESSSDSDSQDVKDQKGMVNGNVDSHETEHRKKKNKKNDKKKAKIRRTDSSAPTSGKQTSDDNAHGDGESGDSRTSQSDSLTSKPAPSSENAITSDSSRDVESKVEMKQLPAPVNQLLEELEVLSRLLNKDDNKTESCIGRLDRALTKASANDNIRRVTLSRAAKILNVSTEAKILNVLKHTLPENSETTAPSTTSQIAQSTANITITSTNSTNTTKRKAEHMSDKSDISMMTAEEKEAKIEETLERLKVLIEDRTPDMMANYQADCARVQEEKKKLQIATASEGAPHIDKRRPKRRFPWCPRSRSLLARLATLAGDPEAGAALLARRALPLFPAGFARMPTLLKQADLNKEVKASDIKRPRLGSSSQPVISNTQFIEPMQFPSSLTVTTTLKTTDKTEEKEPKYKVNPTVLGLNSYTIHKDLVIVKPDEQKKEDRSKDDTFIPNNIGSITITPVISQKEKKEPLLRVKSPAALNEMINKKDKKKPERKQVTSPLHIETNHSNKKDLISPKLKDEITQKQIESMRIAENNIPRPALVSVLHSPTFCKPDKRAAEVKRKKDVLIISDQDPLADNHEPLNIDSCSSDVELVEDTSELKNKSEVPLKGVNTSASVKQKSDSQLDDATKETIDDVMRNLREIQHSQEPSKFNCNSFGGVITSAKREMSTKAIRRPDSRDDVMKKYNLKQNGWMSQADV